MLITGAEMFADNRGLLYFVITGADYRGLIYLLITGADILADYRG